MTEKAWHKSMTEGSYVSAAGTHTAELRSAGHYADAGCKLTRHYVIRLRGQAAIIGYARTLKEAERYL
jgi:hypothetical protein